jgi:hypothetical protein
MLKRHYLQASALGVVLFTAATAWAQKPVTPIKPKPVSQSYTPKHASSERRAILTALRRRLDVKSHFGVAHLKVNGNWAYIRCAELVLHKGKLQETDLAVEALLQRAKPGRRSPWSVVCLWTLPDNSILSREKFLEQVRKQQADRKIARDLFPKNVIAP